jgi:hypothetical protein
VSSASLPPRVDSIDIIIIRCLNQCLRSNRSRLECEERWLRSRPAFSRRFVVLSEVPDAPRLRRIAIDTRSRVASRSTSLDPNSVNRHARRGWQR